MAYTKPYLDIPGQINLIKSRGLLINDETLASECLRRNGYYRLSAYWYPFREVVSSVYTDNFLPNSYFEDAMRLYQFDKTFKFILLDALERVEIAIRSETALLLGSVDPFAHENPGMFNTRFTTPAGNSDYDWWVNQFNKHVLRSKDPFLFHHKRKYGHSASLPIWIAIELWDFGLLSNAYFGLNFYDQSAIASRFSSSDHILLISWLRSLNYVRNVIAHHGRLWNLSLVYMPGLPQAGQIVEFDIFRAPPGPRKKVYVVCCVLSYLTHIINPQSTWADSLKAHIKSFPSMPHASIQDMGFPTNWETHSFWNYPPPP